MGGSCAPRFPGGEGDPQAQSEPASLHRLSPGLEEGEGGAGRRQMGAGDPEKVSL